MDPCLGQSLDRELSNDSCFHSASGGTSVYSEIRSTATTLFSISANIRTHQFNASVTFNAYDKERPILLPVRPSLVIVAKNEAKNTSKLAKNSSLI
ncbi:hypothetical protein DERF_008151 [Dermatophagoides farinae]|uniref:Uncharacterized protein n=1 Tax=Dermatophagoides farinae TaxID=6954 RepID=A0A922I2T7_DERFA|nr:hypothetical protein DERF_008151 [Dermatophagoides farinae]